MKIIKNNVQKNDDGEMVTHFKSIREPIVERWDLDFYSEYLFGVRWAYFRYYFYPMKVLESHGFLAHGGRGKITMLPAWKTFKELKK